jgi:hypothetical protein
MPIGDYTARNYEPGQVARVMVALADSTGIDRVRIRAVNVDPGAPEPRGIGLTGSGHGATSGEVVLAEEILATQPVGEYSATEVEVTDALGNTSLRTLDPPLEFTVSHPPGLDLAGPTASGWGFTNTGQVLPSGAAVVPGNVAQLRDEGVNVTPRSTINFVGGGVTLSDDPANLETKVTIPVGSGTGIGSMAGVTAAPSGDVSLVAEHDLEVIPDQGGNRITLRALRKGDVRRYGAVGDGTTDDTSAIQLAINANAVVYFPRSTSGAGYKVTSQLTVPSNRILVGEGWESRMVRRGTSWPAGEALLRNADLTNGNTDIKLSRICIDGYRSEYTGSEESFCILFNTDNPLTNRCKRISLEGCEVRNWHGITYRFNGVDELRVRGCVAHNNKRGGIVVAKKGSDVVIANNICTELGDDAIALNAYEVVEGGTPVGYVERFTITGNVTSHRSDAAFGAGVAVRGGRWGTVSGNTIRAAKNAGIHVGDYFAHAPVAVNCTSNTIQNGQTDGMELQSDSAIMVRFANNEIYVPASNGIRFYRASGSSAGSMDLNDIAFDNNQVRTPGGASFATAAGIVVEAGTGDAIKVFSASENQISNAARHGIHLQGVSGVYKNARVLGNQVGNSGAQTSGAWGIAFAGLDRFAANNNVVTDLRGTKLTAVGIRCDVSCANGRVSGNTSLDADATTTGIFNGSTSNVTSANNTV